LDRPEEVLVADVRAGLTPSDMVERKLMGLLHGTSVPPRDHTATRA